ncbi:MAG: RsmB/NOP family class I SAM-dependent RNA methyltransferase, partial [Actinomycetota bacterium]|nr:RsmB/NOP family class I SAM-dependent RNA methyltransferase [Actinomycetota bacterium]
PVLDVLRLGAYQILHTRIPAYAAVAATVNLAGSVVGEGPARLVNAVLRKVSKRDLGGWITELSPAAPSVERDGGNQITVTELALRHAHPEWIVRAIADALGPDVAELGAALAANNERPVVHLVARRIARDELSTQVGGEPGPWSPYAVRIPSGGSPHSFAEVRDRRAGVQDEGSQLMALALANAAVSDGESSGWWLDLCAGPGGKAALLAVLAPDDVRILAADRAPHRAQLVARATRGEGVDVISADGLATPWRDHFADRVLVDAPCSGLGALRRRPDARWRRTPQDVADLVELQRGLLAAGLAAARPGGVVAYVTCSPHPAETVDVVEWALARGGATALDARASLPPEMPFLGAGPYVQLWPHRHGTDAMFLALLRV